MRSPKFGIRKEELASVVNKKALASAWRRTVRIAMRRQFLADPIDLLDFHVRLAAECELIEEKLLGGIYSPIKPRRVLVEKSKGLCRQIVVADVRDALVIQCLSDAFYANIKDNAPSKNAFFEPERHLFSELTNEKRTYGSYRSWLQFQKEIFNFARERNYVIVTDIANYYDHVGHAHLRNVITDYVPNAKESILDLLIFALSEMTWQPDYMPRAGVGLPQIDLDGPRLLAHCFLYELDKTVTRTSGVDYVRFMDDIDIGVDDIPTAKRVLRDIDLTLQSRQVRLNSGKTKILTKDEAAKHFKIFENDKISSLENEISTKELNGESVDTEFAAVQALLRDWYSKKIFDDGNGEKILKRLLNILTRHKLAIDPKILDDCLALRPNMRDTVFRHMCYTSPNVLALRSILEYLEGDYVIDDASFVEFAAYFVDSRAMTDSSISTRLHNVIQKLVDSRDGSKLYAAFLILSKIGDGKLIGRHLEASYDYWKNDALLGRVIGSLRPTIWETDYRNKFSSLVLSSRNSGAREVNDFLFFVGNDQRVFSGVRKILFAPNGTFPNRITHSKFLAVRSVLQGGEVLDKDKNLLREIHQTAAQDPHYAAALARPTSVRSRLQAILGGRRGS